MDIWVWLILAVVVLAVAVVAFTAGTRRRHSSRLRDRFGPEYDRAVDSATDRRAAEQELREVAERRDRLDIRPLPEDDRRRHAAEWEAIQRDFVDEPRRAVVDADELIAVVMRQRGYPVDRFEEQAALISADHPDVVESYRDAHAIRERGTESDTEDLRIAFVHYRSLFERMLDDSSAPSGSRTKSSPTSNSTATDPTA